MVDREPETFADIAKRTGRPLSTVRNTWSRDPAWPDSVGKKGRWNTYPPEAVDDFVRDHVDRPEPDLEARRLYTAQDLEDAAIGITAGTIRADLTRGRWPEPDDDSDGVNRWYGSTAKEVLAGRRGYRKSSKQTDEQPSS